MSAWVFFRRMLLVAAWPVLLVIDVGIALCGVSTFRAAREVSRRAGRQEGES